MDTPICQTTTFLSSFQKSGNTWVNFILANLYNLLENRFEEIDFQNIHDIIPEYRNDEAGTPLSRDLPWVLRTHFPFQQLFTRVILLLRNPYDVLYSYYHYLLGEAQKELSLPDVVRHPRYGIRPLIAHNESYLRNCRDLLIVTYERLHENPLKEVKKIIRFLGLQVESGLLETAVEKSCFEAMRRIEVKKGRKYGNPGFLFTRSGKTGEGSAIIKKDRELDLFIMQELKRSPLLYLLYG